MLTRPEKMRKQKCADGYVVYIRAHSGPPSEGCPPLSVSMASPPEGSIPMLSVSVASPPDDTPTL